MQAFSPSDTGEHATRQIFQIFHIIGPISSSVPICTWPRISTFRPISPQRRSALDNENVFQEIRGYYLSVTASHFVVGFTTLRPRGDPPQPERTSVVTRNMQQPPVSCVLVSCPPWRFNRTRGLPGSLPHQNRTNMSCPAHTPFAKDLHGGKYSASYLPHGLSCTASRYAPTAPQL